MVVFSMILAAQQPCVAPPELARYTEPVAAAAKATDERTMVDLRVTPGRHFVQLPGAKTGPTLLIVRL